MRLYGYKNCLYLRPSQADTSSHTHIPPAPIPLRRKVSCESTRKVSMVRSFVLLFPRIPDLGHLLDYLAKLGRTTGCGVPHGLTKKHIISWQARICRYLFDRKCLFGRRHWIFWALSCAHPPHIPEQLFNSSYDQE